VITIGIDPHKASLTAVALDPTGHQLATGRVTVNAGAYKTLMSWAARWPRRRFAVEGAAGLGRGIAQLLATAGEDVVDVPATLAARARLLDTGGTRKTDQADAASVAHAAMRRTRLPSKINNGDRRTPLTHRGALEPQPRQRCPAGAHAK